MNIAFEEKEQQFIMPVTLQTTGAANTQDKIYIPSKQEISAYLPVEKDRIFEKNNGFAGNTIYYLRDSQNGTFSFVRGDGLVADGAQAYSSNYGIVACITVDLSQTVLTPLVGESPTYSITPKNSQNSNGSGAASASFPFADVKPDDWQYDFVQLAYENNLMQGISAQTFDSHGNLTLAQAITMAARTHHNFCEKTETFEEKNPWYQVYADYAIAQQINKGG